MEPWLSGIKLEHFLFEPHSYGVVICSRIGFFFHFFLERAREELSLEALHSASGV